MHWQRLRHSSGCRGRGRGGCTLGTRCGGCRRRFHPCCYGLDRLGFGSSCSGDRSSYGLTYDRLGSGSSCSGGRSGSKGRSHGGGGDSTLGFRRGRSSCSRPEPHCCAWVGAWHCGGCSSYWRRGGCSRRGRGSCSWVAGSSSECFLRPCCGGRDPGGFWGPRCSSNRRCHQPHCCNGAWHSDWGYERGGDCGRRGSCNRWLSSGGTGLCGFSRSLNSGSWGCCRGGSGRSRRDHSRCRWWIHGSCRSRCFLHSCSRSQLGP